MISKLRNRHRLIWLPISFIVFAIFVFIGNRELTPLNEMLPGVSKKVETLYLVDEATVDWESESLNAQIARDGENNLVLTLSSEEYINKPDLLLYLNRIGGQVLTRESILIGSFAQNPDQNFLLPDSSLTNGSVFVLYSLPKNEVVDVAQVTVKEDNQ